MKNKFLNAIISLNTEDFENLGFEPPKSKKEIEAISCLIRHEINKVLVDSCNSSVTYIILDKINKYFKKTKLILNYSQNKRS